MDEPKQLKDIKYPEDFIAPEMKVLSDEDINGLIQVLPDSTGGVAGTGNVLVTLDSACHVEVYIMIAECEVQEVEW